MHISGMTDVNIHKELPPSEQRIRREWQENAGKQQAMPKWSRVPAANKFAETKRQHREQE